MRPRSKTSTRPPPRRAATPTRPRRRHRRLLRRRHHATSRYVGTANRHTGGHIDAGERPAPTHRRNVEAVADNDRAGTMPRVLIRSAATAAVVVTALLLSGLPADACPTCGSGDLSDAGLIARARSQMEELNAGYGGNPSP